MEMATSADAFEDFVAPPSLTHQLRQFRTTERKKIWTVSDESLQTHLQSLNAHWALSWFSHSKVGLKEG